MLHTLPNARDLRPRRQGTKRRRSGEADSIRGMTRSRLNADSRLPSRLDRSGLCQEHLCSKEPNNPPDHTPGDRAGGIRLLEVLPPPVAVLPPPVAVLPPPVAGQL